MAEQYPLPLPVRSAQGREDFFVSPANALALTTLDSCDRWPNGRMILIGPEGAGKSHLAAIWAEAQGAGLIAAAELTAEAAPDLAAHRAVVVEDADRIGDDRPRETALFHLHNLMQAEQGRLLITARYPPRDWGMTLPDLVSRMQASATVQIDAPDDGLLAAVLVKLFSDRQMAVPPALIEWLVLRMDRSLATARRLVEALDTRALAEKRKITRQLASDVLDSLD